MSKLKPEIWELGELLSSMDVMLEETAYKAGKNIKDPKAKRLAKKHYDWVASIHHHLTELSKSVSAETAN